MVLGRIVDVILSFPPVILGIMVTGILGPKTANLVFALATVYMPVFFRIARSGALSEAGQTYVEAARSIGLSEGAILFRHVLRNVLPLILVQYVILFPLVLQIEAALGFLGLGVQPPTPDWGAILQQSKDYILLAPWMSAFPGLAILLDRARPDARRPQPSAAARPTVTLGEAPDATSTTAPLGVALPGRARVPVQPAARLPEFCGSPVGACPGQRGCQGKPERISTYPTATTRCGASISILPPGPRVQRLSTSSSTAGTGARRTRRTLPSSPPRSSPAASQPSSPTMSSVPARRWTAWRIRLSPPLNGPSGTSPIMAATRCASVCRATRPARIYVPRSWRWTGGSGTSTPPL